MTEDQQDVFTDKSVAETYIDAAKKLLMRHGYRVVDPVMINAEIDNQKKLRDHFYMRLASKYPNRPFQRSPDFSADGRIIAKLVESRMETGLGEQYAIQECVAIIDAIFDYEKEFRFKYPIMDTRVLSQGKLGWITSKALALIDDKRREEDHRKIREYAKEAELSVDNDREEVSNRLDNLLKRSMEANIND